MLAFEHDDLLTESEVFQQQAAAGPKATKQGTQKQSNGVEHGGVLPN